MLAQLEVRRMWIIDIVFWRGCETGRATCTIFNSFNDDGRVFDRVGDGWWKALLAVELKRRHVWTVVLSLALVCVWMRDTETADVVEELDEGIVDVSRTTFRLAGQSGSCSCLGCET